MNGRGARPRQDPPIEHALPCTLEELYKGTSKRMKISRNVAEASGRSGRVEETLAVDVKPGWKKGTKVTFPKKGERSLTAWFPVAFQCLSLTFPRQPSARSASALHSISCEVLCGRCPGARRSRLLYTGAGAYSREAVCLAETLALCAQVCK